MKSMTILMRMSRALCGSLRRRQVVCNDCTASNNKYNIVWNADVAAAAANPRSCCRLLDPQRPLLPNAAVTGSSNYSSNSRSSRRPRTFHTCTHNIQMCPLEMVAEGRSCRLGNPLLLPTFRALTTTTTLSPLKFETKVHITTTTAATGVTDQRAPALFPAGSAAAAHFSPTTTPPIPPSFQSPASVWKSWTVHLLTRDNEDDNHGNNFHDNGTTTTTAIRNRDASASQWDAVLKWWVRQRPLTTEAADMSWKLHKAAVRQQQWQLSPSSDENTAMPTTTLRHPQHQRLLQQQQHQQQWFNLVLDHWRLSRRERRRRVVVPYSAAQVWQHYFLLDPPRAEDPGAAANSQTTPTTSTTLLPSLVVVPPTLRSYCILLSAIAHESEHTNNGSQPSTTSSKQHHGNQKNASIALAEEILQHYLQHRTHDQSLSSPLMSSEDENFSAASTVILWNSVLTVVAKQGRGPDVGEQAEALLRRMMMISPSSLPATLTTNTTLVQPNEISYACVLEAWAGTAPSNPHAGTNAERLLREMIVTCGKLRRRQQQATRGGNENAATVATGVSSSSSPFHEDNTTSFHGGTNSSMSVDTAASTCYLHVLRAWSKCTHHPDGADRANQILQGMVRHYLRQTNDSNDDDTDDNEMEYYPNVKPSRHCFSAVMSGYADRGQPENVEQLLGELQTLYQSSGGDPLLYPTTAVFNSVLEAYVQQGTPASAARAQQLLERLYQTAVVADNTNHSQFYRLCLPDTTSVNTCIHGWAESGAPDAVERAEALLVAASEWTGVSPDPYSYTTVMKAWSRSDRPEAAERCEQILRSMWERYEQSTLPDDTTSTTVWKKLKPNHVTYSTAIYTWSIATHNPDAPLRAEAIYQDMLKRYQNGDRDLKPTLSIFLALITAWAHSNRKESDVRAQVYFDQMRGLYMAGDDSVRPTDKVYNALIASKKRLNDGEGAEQILKHMYDDYLNHGNKAARPNRFVFHNVMSAWANSKRPDANHRIEAMLIQMQKEHETRKWDCKPNRMDFNILLTSLGKLKSRESAKRAESVLRHMYALSEASGDNGVKPNSHCCATALNAWASTIHVPEAPLHAKAIFDDMWRRFEAGDQDLKPCGQCYSALLTTWAKSNHVEAGRRALVILNEMEDRHAIDATHKPPGPYHYTAVINAFANSGDVDNAERVLQRIANRGDIRVHRTSLNAVLKAYSRWTGPEMVERAVQLLHDMRSVYLHSPDVVSYTTFLLCLQRSRRPDAYASGKSVVEQMVLLSDRGETAVTPNVATFATLLATLNESCTMSLADKIHEAEDITTLMDHVRVQPTTSILQELHRIRQHK